MKVLLIAITLMFGTNAIAQTQSVTWKFSSKKIKEGEYELSMIATVPSGWHLYSQATGEGPVATTFTFNKNGLVTLDGKVTEKGKMVSVKDKVFNNTQKYYMGTVTFSQKVKVKGKIKTSVTGEVEYMICDDKQCLPPTTNKFKITL